MGCHTWFYRKTELDSDEKILARVKTLLEEWELQENSQVDAQHLGMVRYALKMNFVEWLVDSVLWQSFSNLIFYNNGVVYEEMGTHDLFRVGDYPETVLHSMEETQEFIQANVTGGEIHWEKLREFWKEHPEGIITFG